MKNQFNLISGPLAEQIGWTLVHSVWQLLFIVSIYLITILFTKNVVKRYWTGTALLLLQLVISILTFLMVGEPISKNGTVLTSFSNLRPSFFQTILFYLERNVKLISVLWSIGAGLLFLKLVFGYFSVYKLKNSKINIPQAKLDEILRTLVLKMKITQAIGIKMNAQILVPMIMGTLKPLILIPVSLISRLSTEQLEVIIAHELAHLKRNDFLINILQSIVDIVFFYHPAMWWFSAQIRKERENCCDDMAIKVTGNKILLAKTLIQIQEGLALSPRLALAFGKKTFSLKDRILRIIGVSNRQNPLKESIWVAMGLLITFLAIAKSNNPSKKSYEKNQLILADTLRAKKDTLIIEKESIKRTVRTNFDNNELNFHINQGKDKFSIQNKEIIFNGKSVPLSEEEKKKVSFHIEEIKKKNREIEIQAAGIEKESLKMQEFTDKIQMQNAPMQEVSMKMGTIGQLMGQISSKYANLMKNRELSKAELEKLEEKMEIELAVQEKKLNILEKEMEVLSEKMELNEPAMQKIEIELETLSEPLEALSEQLDGHFQSILKLMPLEIQNKISLDHIAPPPPPRAPTSRKLKNLPPPPPPPRVPKGVEQHRNFRAPIAPPPTLTKPLAPPPPPPAPPKVKSKVEDPKN